MIIILTNIFVDGLYYPLVYPPMPASLWLGWVALFTYLSGADGLKWLCCSL